ncbi:MAG: response regulator [Kofleriaceae bacterium]
MTAYRILVVDDYPSSAQITCTLLELLGHVTTSARTGKQALELGGSFQPDLVILDIGLPDISGFDVARALRSAAGNRKLFLAALTGWGQPEDRSRALAAGFDHHVLKPASAAKLRDILRRAELVLSAGDPATA